MDENQTIDQDRIMKVNIEEEMKSSYIDYSMSVIVARALPDVCFLYTSPNRLASPLSRMPTSV